LGCHSFKNCAIAAFAPLLRACGDITRGRSGRLQAHFGTVAGEIPESFVAHFVVLRALVLWAVNLALIHPDLGCGEGIMS
jgi:hypothetical protein